MPEFIPTGQIRRWSETQATTRAAPTLATEGLSLNEVNAYRVFVDADAGQTLAGAGNLRAWYWCEDTQSWIRDPDLDLAVTAAGQRRQVYGDLVVGVPFGRVLYAAEAVTVSGGALTLRIVASTAFIRR